MSEDNSTDRVAHDSPHEITYVDAAAGWSVAFETSANGRHARLVLCRDAGPAETLACWHGEPGDAWGVPPADLADLVCHAIWHAATGAPPAGDCALL